ncbi:pyridoxamine 5'-phosphate oxidase family protein [Kitasatospora purpeofusca]|uniref:pyridoxamine 5'-phosphate oxidase family protein n=1 Tax=Kitasatospora purpeofusca TaxID=67352 RepID=UPI00224D7255|nr:pyridoxamine 5'-phosphate oxidase family protein [Kitasatospora purpeofusca]MCX4682853.1 pyridoxamine 5'-phosphate oxidase family protein [Kitasatospora purpeofusca]
MTRIPDLEAVRRANAVDVARRIDERRRQLGVDEAALAREAAMAPSYLRHLLEAGPGFDAAGFVRVAAVLRMTWTDLLEDRSDAPPGQAEPAAGVRPLLRHLTEPECWDLVGTHGVGRVALPADPGPSVYPVNYAVDRQTIVYRTSPREAAAPPESSPVSFQIDHLDDRLSEGWSVLMLGTAHHVEDVDEQQRLLRLPGATPWAGGSRPLWVRVVPNEVTGRRLGGG